MLATDTVDTGNIEIYWQRLSTPDVTGHSLNRFNLVVEKIWHNTKRLRPRLFFHALRLLSSHENTVYLLTCTCVGIHPGRVEPASPVALTTSRTEALQARRSCASSLDIFTQSYLHRAWPKTRDPEVGSRSALIVVANVFSCPPALRATCEAVWVGEGP